MPNNLAPLLSVPGRTMLSFFSRVSIEVECWLWNGAVNEKGYGVFNPDTEASSESAHRTSYRWFVDGGLLPDHDVHHVCGNTRCVNPTHLRAMSRAEHGAEHRRLRERICPKGHIMDDGNVVLCSGSGRNKTVQRKCAICARANGRERYLGEVVHV